MTRCAPGGSPTSRSAAAASSPASTSKPSLPSQLPSACPQRHASAARARLRGGTLRSRNQAERTPMRQVTTVGIRFRQAHGLPAVLDAAWDAFEAILTVISDYEDITSTGAAFTFLLVATQAANGRDALLFAPSLPPRALHPMAAPDEPEGASVIKSSVAGVSELLATG